MSHWPFQTEAHHVKRPIVCNLLVCVQEDPVFGSGLEKTLAAEPARAHRTQPRTNGIDEVTVKPHAISGDLKPYYHGRYSPRAYYQPTRIEPFCDLAKTMPSRPVP